MFDFLLVDVTALPQLSTSCPGARASIPNVSPTFEDLDGKTRLTMKSIYQSVGDRDAMVETVMESGAIDSLERLAEVLSHS